VANRRFWSLTVEHECARAERTGFPVCVAVIEVDGFRDLAFERGHAAAEQLMREAATAFDDHVRAGDLVGRLSPEQIGVLLPDCGSAAARLVLERLQTAAPPGKTCSAGVAMWDGGESPERLVERAAEALRVAQRAGRSHGMIAAA
jgi:diguanylate cyclase (GGDEF)-like protein